jgi:predicted acetyltransferase
MTVTLVRPGPEHLPSYVDALNRGWSPDTMRDASAEHLDKIAADPDGYLAGMDDPQGKAGDVTLPDGSRVKRLPGVVRFAWDGDFCGAINFRWQAGTEALPPYVLGHIGYSVVPWKQGNGYATAALGLLLPEARAQGLRWVILTTNPANIASQRVIEHNGGVLEARFDKPEAFGGGEGLRWRIDIPCVSSRP